MALTKNGVAYALSESPYKVHAVGCTFYFSTVYHKRNFQQKLRSRQEWLTDSHSRRFHFFVNCTLLATFQLYQQIETRGFYVVEDSGKVFDSANAVKMTVVM